MSLSDDTYDRLFYDSDYRSFMDSSYGSYDDESDESTVIEEEILSPMKELDVLCKSNELSIAELQKIKNNIFPTLWRVNNSRRTISIHSFIMYVWIRM